MTSPNAQGGRKKRALRARSGIERRSVSEREWLLMVTEHAWPGAAFGVLTRLLPRGQASGGAR